MKSIMIQGTASNVGKSLICAGLCRIFKQDGYKVAPFKSQNMALNSFVTREGLEIGRAQAVQAEAAGIEPSADMNPILLKPMGGRTQIIFQGEVFGYTDAHKYRNYKELAAEKIKESWERLSPEYDFVIIEGAGSPAEINLKKSDVSNMFTAKLTNSPVLLVGDIDPGGVFAQIVGTNVIFDEEERNYFKGVLINKFRGDVSLLKPGLDMLEDMINRPVLGVIPYGNFDIDDEDSMSRRFSEQYGQSENNIKTIADIAVIRLPHLSNFTDFTALGRIPGLGLRYVNSVSSLGKPDLIILPGTKSTINDLEWLRKTGLEDAVTALATNEDCPTPIFGICGGYQMLGEELSDPNCVETESGGKIRGMGLLPVRTEFENAKIRTRVSGKFARISGIFSELSDCGTDGYELHMGITAAIGEVEVAPLCYVKDEITGTSKADGACFGNVYGTYIHGIFDAPNVASTVLKSICRAKGGVFDFNQTADFISYQQYKETQYDLLADTIRQNVDIERIYSIIERGV